MVRDIRKIKGLSLDDEAVAEDAQKSAKWVISLLILSHVPCSFNLLFPVWIINHRIICSILNCVYIIRLFGNETKNRLPLGEFLTAVGQLKFRGTSVLFRLPQSCVSNLKGYRTFYKIPVSVIDMVGVLFSLLWCYF